MSLAVCVGGVVLAVIVDAFGVKRKEKVHDVPIKCALEKCR